MPALIDRIRTDLLPTLAYGWRWWIGELWQLLPQGLSSRGRRADVRPSRNGVEIVRVSGEDGERLHEAKPLSAFDEDNWRELASLLTDHHVRLLLAPPLSHVITIKLPKAARPYLRTAIPLKLAEHAPLPPDQLDWARSATRLVGENLQIRIAMARKEVLDTIEAGFREHDMAPPPMLAELDDNGPLVLRRPRGDHAGLSPPWLWALAILAMTPLILWAVLHLMVLHERHRVADLADLARPRMANERHIREQAILAHGLDQILAAPSVSSLLEDLADRLPPSTHALVLSGRDDGAIDITLSTTDTEAARTAMLGDPRFASLGQIDVTQAQDRSSTVHVEARVR